MTDWHVHVGQWHETYYDPAAVVRALKAGDTEEKWNTLVGTNSDIGLSDEVKINYNYDGAEDTEVEP